MLRKITSDKFVHHLIVLTAMLKKGSGRMAITPGI